MKICIPFKIQETGGTSSFVKKFKSALEENHIEVILDPKKKCDLLFLVAHTDLRVVQFHKRNGAKIIQRLDGVYYYRVKGIFYPFWNLRMRLIHNHFADYIIYQSKFSKFLCNQFLGPSKKPWSIIFNGVDTLLFQPGTSSISLKEYDTQKILLTVGEFRRKDMFEPLLGAMQKLVNLRSDFKFVIVGPMTQRMQKRFRKTSFGFPIEHLGAISHESLPLYEKAADVFLFSDISACPNAIIEALSSGLPAIIYNRGGAPELIHERCGINIPHSKTEFYRLKSFDTQAFAEGINTLLHNLPEFKRNARLHAVRSLSLEEMTKNYLNIFTHLLNKEI